MESSDAYAETCIVLQQKKSAPCLKAMQKNQEDARRSSGSLAKMALGAIFKADQQALDAEYNYYDIVQDALRELFGI